MSTEGAHGSAPGDLETLSRIIAELNERFGLNLGPEQTSYGALKREN